MGLLLIAEVALSRTVDPVTFGEYQFVRQMLPMLVAATIFGVDQALTRMIAEGGSDDLLLPVVWRSGRLWLILAAPVVACSAYYFGIGLWGCIALAVAPMALIASELVAAALRASGRYSRAALAQQGYRLFAAVTVLAAAAISMPSITGVTALWLGSAIFGAWSIIHALRTSSRSLRPNRTKMRRLRIMGAGFGISMLPTSAIDWVDQAAVAYSFGTLAESGHYAAVKLVTVYPFVTLASILGFVALPEVVKRASSLNRRVWRTATICTAAASAAFWCLCSIPLTFMVPVLLGRAVDHSAIWILCAVGAVRIFYLLPSSVLGAVGTSRQLATSGFVGILAVGAEAAVILFVEAADPVVVGGAGLLTATIVRTSVAYFIAGSAVKNAKKSQAEEHVLLS
ncbi:hypothetical protein AB0368_28720 [Actinoplanes sp. NPDC051475]|uniref:hypothetical protein n=1 Tax=Actinoplanes sp. NPDC051475 TaxID=3157225 RepID=UPI00344F04B0